MVGESSFTDLSIDTGCQPGLPIRASLLSLLLWPGLPHSMVASWLLDSDTVTQLQKQMSGEAGRGQVETTWPFLTQLKK